MRFRYSLAAVLLLLPSIAFASESATAPLAWWQIATGILGIPAAILGLAYSYFQIQKTRVETRKIALEVRQTEKELGLEQLGPALMAAGKYRGRLIVLYLLLASGSIAGYTFIFSGTTLFPITVGDTVIIYALILPVMAAQLTLPLIRTRNHDFSLTAGTALLWAIAAPLVAIALFGVTIFAFVISNLPSAPIGAGLTTQSVIVWVALSITILNVATIQITARMIVVEPDRHRLNEN